MVYAVYTHMYPYTKENWTAQTSVRACAAHGTGTGSGGACQTSGPLSGCWAKWNIRPSLEVPHIPHLRLNSPASIMTVTQSRVLRLSSKVTPNTLASMGPSSLILPCVGVLRTSFQDILHHFHRDAVLRLPSTPNAKACTTLNPPLAFWLGWGTVLRIGGLPALPGRRDDDL